jgi:nitroreductase
MTEPLNDRSSAMALLLSRRSAKARELVAPGPDGDQLDRILTAAARVPDHGKLAPWRFVVVENRDRFGDLLVDLLRAERPDLGTREEHLIRGLAHEAPLLIVLLHCPVPGKIPDWEQQLSTGAAGQNLLLAAHALGFAANWLTPAPAYAAGLPAALGHPQGRVAGFIFIGTASAPAEERPRPALSDVVQRF